MSHINSTKLSSIFCRQCQSHVVVFFLFIGLLYVVYLDNFHQNLVLSLDFRFQHCQIKQKTLSGQLQDAFAIKDRLENRLQLIYIEKANLQNEIDLLDMKLHNMGLINDDRKQYITDMQVELFNFRSLKAVMLKAGLEVIDMNSEQFKFLELPERLLLISYFSKDDMLLSQLDIFDSFPASNKQIPFKKHSNLSKDVSISNGKISNKPSSSALMSKSNEASISSDLIKKMLIQISKAQKVDLIQIQDQKDF